MLENDAAVPYREVAGIDVFNAKEQQAYLTHQAPLGHKKSLVAKLYDGLACNLEQQTTSVHNERQKMTQNRR